MDYINDMNAKLKIVKEKFKRNEIKVNLTHDSYIKDIFTGKDLEKKLDMFENLFSVNLVFLNNGMNNVRGLGGDCRECGESIIYLYDGKELTDWVREEKSRDLKKVECKKVEDYSFEVNFPTGKVIYADRLPYSQEICENFKSKVTLNSEKGLKETTLNYAKENILHVFVGNTCPSIYKYENSLAIGNNYEEEDISLTAIEEIVTKGTELGNICTDLWWGSMVDFEIYKELLINHYKEEFTGDMEEELHENIINIKPGVYKATYHRVDEEKIQNNIDIYCSLKWIRE